MTSSNRGRLPGSILLLLVLPLVPAVLAGWLHPRRPDWSELRSGPVAGAVNQLEIQQALRDYPDALWIDARPASDYAVDHVPGAVSLEEENWEAGFSALADVWDGRQAIIVYCGGESCHASTSVAERLRRELGAEAVHVLRGGWPAWKSAMEDRARP
jgi:Rhodanese-related sulfurtransferase